MGNTPMQSVDDMLEWISTASYEALLLKWRYEQPGSKWFSGEVGTAFDKKMKQCRQNLTIEQAIEISKRVGWERSTNHRDFKSYD